MLDNMVDVWAYRSTTSFRGSVTRAFYRKLYQAASWLFCTFSPDWQLRLNMYRGGCFQIDTYAWPYCNWEFADWAKYGQITDSAGFAIRSSMSYCTQKLREAGYRLKYGQEKPYTPEWWGLILMMTGFSECVQRPSDKDICVGLAPDLTVWFEANEGPLVVYSTYRDGQHLVSRDLPERFTWIRIKGRK